MSAEKKTKAKNRFAAALARKDSPTPAAGKSSGTAAVEGKRIALTVRLDPKAWRQLRNAALDDETTAQEILVAALNAWFEKHDLPKIA